METQEYSNLESVERRHWYYVGKRELVRHWLERCGPLKADLVLLDYGAGTGLFAQELSLKCRALVADDHEESLQLLRQRFPVGAVIAGSGCSIAMDTGSIDFLTALDVVEHVEKDANLIAEFARVLKPGGTIVVTVPALMSLWSDWDVALHHYRRYDRAGLKALFSPEIWDIRHINYTNVVAFPFVWLLRKSRSSSGKTSKNQNRLEDKVPPAWLNQLLKRIFVGMGKVSVRFPFGVSLILVARKK